MSPGGFCGAYKTREIKRLKVVWIVLPLVALRGVLLNGNLLFIGTFHNLILLEEVNHWPFNHR